MMRKILCGAMLGAVACLPLPAIAQQAVPAAPAAADAADPLFAQPYVDKDEQRQLPRPHRYIHGGFTGTETRFSFYFPPVEQFEGRFFQHITPVPDDENLAQIPAAGEEDKMGFAFASGGYFVETNGGGRAVAGFGSSEPTIGAYRANAAAARFSRQMAQQVYGGNRRIYGYAYGGSGGGYRTVGSIENTRGAWDGAVPYVLGSPMAIPNMFSVRMHAMRLLDGKLDAIVDAVEPGGSGNPYAGLNDEQAEALREVTAMGFPTPSWFGHRTMGVHGFAALYPGIVMADPSYFTDFWTKPGYLGHDNPASFANARMQHSSSIAAPITALEAAQQGLNTSVVGGKRSDGASPGTPTGPRDGAGSVDFAFAALQGEAGQRIVGFRLTTPPPALQFLGGDLVINSGPLQGQRLPAARIIGDVVILGFANPAQSAMLAAGDRITVDNSNFLAAQTYHRHQLPGRDYPVWDQFRNADGSAKYPQRPMLLGPLFTRATVGSDMNGRFEGKVILVESLWDREALAWQGDWYRQQVTTHFGAATDDHFRLYLVDHALHGDKTAQEDPTRTVSYLGALQQALRDLAAWVEQDIAPPASTQYRIENGQIIPRPTASARMGIQAVVQVKANGGARADVSTGQWVRFTARAEVPRGGGKIVAAEWDFTGDGSFAVKSQLADTPRPRINLQMRYRFDKPGTYFPSLRITSERNGDTATPYARVQNLGRVRVVVKPR